MFLQPTVKPKDFPAVNLSESVLAIQFDICDTPVFPRPAIKFFVAKINMSNNCDGPLIDQHTNSNGGPSSSPIHRAHERLESDHSSLNPKLIIRIGAKQIISLFIPVSICMFFVAFLSKNVPFFSNADVHFIYAPFNTPNADIGTLTWQTLVNVAIILTFVVVTTFVLVLLFKFECYKFLTGWLIITTFVVVFVASFIFFASSEASGVTVWSKIALGPDFRDFMAEGDNMCPVKAAHREWGFLRWRPLPDTSSAAAYHLYLAMTQLICVNTHAGLNTLGSRALFFLPLIYFGPSSTLRILIWKELLAISRSLLQSTGPSSCKLVTLILIPTMNRGEVNEINISLNKVVAAATRILVSPVKNLPIGYNKLAAQRNEERMFP
ncbi:hypothetical protein ACTXT7_007074 [Hymenolepis weldensis]